MAVSIQTTTLKTTARVAFVSFCLFALAVLPATQRAVVYSTMAAESECPSHEERENCEEAFDICQTATGREPSRSAAQHLAARVLADQRWRVQAVGKAHWPVVGHTLANGLCAPLRL